MDPELNPKLFTKLTIDAKNNNDYSAILESLNMATKPKTSEQIFIRVYNSFIKEYKDQAEKCKPVLQAIAENVDKNKNNPLELKSFLSIINDKDLFNASFYKQIDNYDSAENVYSVIIKKHPNIIFLNESSQQEICFVISGTTKYISSFDKENWQLPFYGTIVLFFNPINHNKFKVVDFSNHPYHSYSTQLCASPKSLLDAFKVHPSKIFIEAIDAIINHYTVGAADYISQAKVDDFVGKKCSICNLRSKSKIYQRCSIDNALVHQTCAVKHTDGLYYSPQYIKKCDICKKDTPFWIKKSDQIICEGCSND